MVSRQNQTKTIRPDNFLALPSSHISWRNSGGRSIFEVGAAVTLLIILALLITNIFLMSLARDFNAQVCSTAAKAGANAAAKGADHHDIARSVIQAINDSSAGGVLIERPSLNVLHFDTLDGQERLIVGTIVRAKVPAPLLIWSDAVSPEGLVVFSKTCIINIKPARA